MSKSLLYPAIGGAPGSAPTREPAQAPDRISGSEAPAASQIDNQTGFAQLLGSELARPVTEPLKFSAHASARLTSRNLQMNPEQMRKLNEAVDKAAAKGLDETLILTKDAAFIVSARNRTVVTAMDRGSLEGNVFTNIEGAVVIQ